MGLFDLFLKKNNGGNKLINFSKRMYLEEAEVDIMFIVKNGNVLYVNDYADSLYNADSDGDLKLDGRVVNFTFQARGEIIQIFVAFDDPDAYTMFTMNMGRDERLNFVAQSIFKFMMQNKITNVFSPTSTYSSQYLYTFKLYKKGEKHFMINNGQNQAYLISKDSFKNKNVAEIKAEFWET